MSQRVSSIRTRIKTNVMSLSDMKLTVREYLPLEQGLRHRFICFNGNTVKVREYLPLEQGLRHIWYLSLNL